MLFKSIKVVKLFKKYLNDLIYSFVKYFAKLLNFRLFTFINNGPISLFFSKSFIFVNSRLVSNSQDSASTIKWEDLTDDTKNKFLMDGAAGVTKYFFEKTDSTEIFYDKKIVNKLLKKVRKNAYFYYGETDKYLYESLKDHKINSKEVAILGSTLPWYESIVLGQNGRPTTIEYNKINTNDNRLKIITYDDLIYKKNKFEFIFSISSFEHDGLGRYGDNINPNGDLEAMEYVYENLIADNGKLFLSVPIGKDQVVFNAHRIYGKKRFFKLIEGFKIINSYGFEEDQFNRYSESGHLSSKKISNHPFQPIFVLQKI